MLKAFYGNDEVMRNGNDKVCFYNVMNSFEMLPYFTSSLDFCLKERLLIISKPDLAFLLKDFQIIWKFMHSARMNDETFFQYRSFAFIDIKILSLWLRFALKKSKWFFRTRFINLFTTYFLV